MADWKEIPFDEQMFRSAETVDEKPEWTGSSVGSDTGCSVAGALCRLAVSFIIALVLGFVATCLVYGPF